MYKNLRWKLILIGAVIAIAAFAIIPPSQKIHLGIDLRGGLHLVLKVVTDDAIKVETESTAEQLKTAAKDGNIPIGDVRATGLTTFTADGVPPASDSAFKKLADDRVGQTFDRSPAVNGTYTFTMKPNKEAEARRETVAQAILTIEKRVNAYGVTEPFVGEYGTTGDQIMVQLPGLNDVSRVEGLIQNTAFLELKLVEGGPAPDEKTLLAGFNGVVPPDMEVVQGAASASSSTTTPVNEFFLVRKVAAVTGRDLRTARTSLDQYNQPAVGFTLNSQGTTKFAAVTTANVGRSLAIILDNRVQSAPRIDGPITTADAQITGRFTQEEANDLALVLKSGALPASLTYLEREEIGPQLGQDSIKAGVMASIMGLSFVAVFMLLYYRLSGINALVSVALNLLILLAFMAYLKASMTLPGIAGFILTIGMGVDSNVLIFERIREELAARKGVRQAIAAGFDRVFITIVDTHVSSLIAAAFLFQFGTGPIRGFATTLFFGLVSNVFTAVFVSRTLFEWILSRKPVGATTMSI